MSRPDTVTFTVGKLDAGMAILLGENAHLIEFPSVLLPPGSTTGSIVNIAVHANHEEEKRREKEFWQLQDAIVQQFAVTLPTLPILHLRNITQTAVVLEWDPLELATAGFRSLDLYRNGTRLSPIPSPQTNAIFKHTSLEPDTPYDFQLVLRTTAGVFPSKILHTRTHDMLNTSGVVVCLGNIDDPEILEKTKEALDEMGAKWRDTVEIDTTHYVCRTPAGTPVMEKISGAFAQSQGVEYKKAIDTSIPIVQPEWVLACYTERRMVSISKYYLGVTVNSSPWPTSFGPRSKSMSVSAIKPGSPNADDTRAKDTASKRASLPATSPSSSRSPTFNNASSSSASREPPLTEEPEPDPETELHRTTSVTSTESKRKSRSGTMNREFKFPPVSTKSPDSSEGAKSIEVPPPPPVEKEIRSPARSTTLDDDDDVDVGSMAEVSLN